MANQDTLVTPPIRQSVEDANSAAANGIAQPMTEKSWYLFWDRLGKMANRQNWMVNVGTHANRPPAANMPNGAIYVEFDRGVIYQNWSGAWQYLGGTMWGTLVPDQRPTDLGSHDAGFDYRTTDAPPREFIWSGTAWIEIGAEYLVNGTLIGTRPALNLIAGSNVTISGSDNAGSDRVDVTVSSTGGGGTGAVTSVFGRTGAVVATSTDYSAYYVPVTRQVLAGTGMTGGGALSADVTLTAQAMGASGASHSVGIVPDPGATAGTTRFLREDATWAAAPGSQTPWLSNINGAGFNLTNASQVGIGSTSAIYPLDIRTPGSTSSQVHIASTNTDAGGYLLSVNDASVHLAGGASFNGTAWVAKATSAAYVNVGTGGFTFTGDSGLTVGSSYTPTVRMQINATGFVGIGTTNQLYRLDVRTPGSITSQVHIASTDTDAGAYLLSAGSNNFNISAGSSYNGTNWIAKSTLASAINFNNAGLLTFNCDTGLTAGNAFTPTTRVTIAPIGLGIGLSPTHQLQLSGDDAAKTTTNTWAITSGAKVKRHVKRLEGGLEIINRLSPTEAEYNGKAGTPEGQRVVSLIAEEVREVLPHTVTEDSEGNLWVNIHEVIHHLVLAVQQLSKKIG